jgi:hypothetical protein
MAEGNTYNAPNLPLSGTETLTIFQQQGGKVVTRTATVEQIAVAPFGFIDGDVEISSTGEATVIGINGTPLGETTPTAGNVLLANGTDFLSTPLSGDVSLGGDGTATVNANVAGGFPRLDGNGGLSAQTVIPTGGSTSETLAAVAALAVFAAQTPNVYTFLTNVAAIASYTGNSPAIRTAGYAAIGDGGGAFYTQTNTGFPAAGITDGLGRLWYYSDVFNDKGNIKQFGCVQGVDISGLWTAIDTFLATHGKTMFVPALPNNAAWTQNAPLNSTVARLEFEAMANINFNPLTCVFQATFAPAAPVGSETPTSVMTPTTSPVNNSLNGAAALPIAVGMALYGTGASGPSTILQNLGGGQWLVSNTITHASAVTVNAAADLTTAITQTSNSMSHYGGYITGPDGSVPATANLVTQRYIFVTSQNLTLTITGNTAVVTSGNGQSIVTGNQLIGPNLFGTLANGTVVSPKNVYITNPTPGAANPTLTLSPPSGVTLTNYSGAGTFTTTNLPNSNALASGCVGISYYNTAKGKVEFQNASNFKFGFSSNSYQGHIYTYNCNGTGWFSGKHWITNSYDYHETDSGYSGAVTGISCGNSSDMGGNGGGITAILTRCWLGSQVPYIGLQLNTTNAAVNASASGFYIKMIGGSGGNIKEAAFQSLPGATNALNLDTANIYWSGSNVNNMPGTLVSKPRTAMFELGLINGFTANPLNSLYAADTNEAGNYLQVALQGTAAPAGGPLELGYVQSTNIYRFSSNFQNWVNPPYRNTAAFKGDFEQAQGLAYAPNMLQNPEQNTAGNALSTGGGNWTVVSGSMAVTSSSYSSSDLAAIPLKSNDILRYGTNPQVTKIVATGGSGTIGLPVFGNNGHVGTNQPVWLRFSTVQIGATGVQIGYNLGTTDGKYLYNNTQNFSGQNVYSEVFGVDESPGSVGSTTGIISLATVSLNAAGTLYVIGMMAGTGNPGPYNPLPYAYAPNGMMIGGGATVTSQNGVLVFAGAGAPTITTFPAGSVYLQNNATTGNTGIWSLVAGAWVSAAPSGTQGSPWMVLRPQSGYYRCLTQLSGGTVASGSGAFSTTTAYFQPISAPNAITVSQLGIDVVTAATGSVTVGIYTNNSGGSADQPLSLLGSVSISTGATGSIFTALSNAINLVPGVIYWIGIIQVGTATIRQIGSGAVWSGLGISPTTGSYGTMLSIAGSGGALPATFSGTPTMYTGNVPMIICQ